MPLQFKHYRLDSIYLAGSAAQHAEIAAFWLRERAIADPDEARRRAHEVVFTVRRDATGELAGVSTVGLQRLRDDRVYYAYRMFLRKQDRVPYLMWAVADATRDRLRTLAHPPGSPHGMLIVTENPKLMRVGMRRSFLRHGYRYGGQNGRGQDIWLTEFDQDTSPGSQATPGQVLP